MCAAHARVVSKRAPVVETKKDCRAYTAKFMGGQPVMLALPDTDMKGMAFHYKALETWTCDDEKMTLYEVCHSKEKAESLAANVGAGLIKGADMFHLVDSNGKVAVRWWQTNDKPGNIEIVFTLNSITKCQPVRYDHDIMEKGRKQWSVFFGKVWNRDKIEAVWDLPFIPSARK